MLSCGAKAQARISGSRTVSGWVAALSLSISWYTVQNGQLHEVGSSVEIDDELAGGYEESMTFLTDSSHSGILFSNGTMTRFFMDSQPFRIFREQRGSPAFTLFNSFSAVQKLSHSDNVEGVPEVGDLAQWVQSHWPSSKSDTLVVDAPEKYSASPEFQSIAVFFPVGASTEVMQENAKTMLRAAFYLVPSHVDVLTNRRAANFRRTSGISNLSCDAEADNFDVGLKDDKEPPKPKRYRRLESERVSTSNNPADIRTDYAKLAAPLRFDFRKQELALARRRLRYKVRGNYRPQLEVSPLPVIPENPLEEAPAAQGQTLAPPKPPRKSLMSQ